jgi:hypothetical protein
MSTNRRLARIVSAAVLGCVVASTAFSQDAEQEAATRARELAARQAELQALAARQAAVAAQVPAGGIDPNSLAGKESTEGVYVRDSALALEKFALAQRMERLKEWAKSADVYQEVMDRYPDRVVPSRTNDEDKIIQYTSVSRGVMERLARWPKEGLDVYRARFEPTAAQLIESATAGGKNDLAEMHKVFYRYFVTDTARGTGIRLLEMNLGSSNPRRGSRTNCSTGTRTSPTSAPACSTARPSPTGSPGTRPRRRSGWRRCRTITPTPPARCAAKRSSSPSRWRPRCSS